MREVWLELSSLAGRSLGATHVYGKLIIYQDGHEKTGEEEILKALTAEDIVKIQAQAQETGGKLVQLMAAALKPGGKTHSFDTEQEVIDEGLRMFKEKYDDGNTLLFLGDVCVAEPQKVLAGPKDEMTVINGLARCLDVCRQYGYTELEDDVIDLYWTFYNWLRGTGA